ncbi:TPA: hypothetical protein N0F65_000699 [Lagenidium giganteum]|uniref:Golgi apparatus membrane protein TVP15 n=1 Tax=Lagenidium giganteum TaxID=4803 RepID=A0AAV2YWJ5_9STRA|nr:TPA: hypothetical protein N0F65_000699 [Lagenidium giganteum]
MMEASQVSMGKPPMQSPRAAAGENGAKMQMPQMPQMPKALQDKTDDLVNRISGTDIARINGYMRFANLIGGGILAFVCFIRMWSVPSYAHFLVIIYMLMMTTGLIFIENHERFPSVAEKIKLNFGFMFTASGKAGFILAISFLSFSQGVLGALLGVFFLLLGAFNFFLIARHPAYQAAMTSTSTSKSQAADVEMPDLRYNNQASFAQQPSVAQSASAQHIAV